MVHAKWWVVPVLALGLGSCATNHATGGPAFSLISDRGERELGAESALYHIKLHSLYKPESKATRYVTNLCNKVYAVTEEAAKPVSCIVLDSGQYNAWAAPGYVNVYRGMLPYMDSEADLVATLAHETGHLMAHHSAQHYTLDALAKMGIIAASLYVAADDDNDIGDLLAATQLTASVAQLGSSTYSRAAEREADALSLRYMERLGYDKREAVTSMLAMQAKEAYDHQVEVAFNGGKLVTQTLYGTLHASHPPTPERIADTRTLAGGDPDGGVKLPAGIQPATSPSDPQGRNRFLTAMDGLEYGPRTKWGVAGRDYVAIPKLRFVWRLPDGFVPQYKESGVPRQLGEWHGVHPQTGVTFKSQFIRYKAGMNVGHLLQDMFPAFDDGLQRMHIGRGEGAEVAYTGTLKQWMSMQTARVVAVPMQGVNAAGIFAFVYPNAEIMAREDATIMREFQKSAFISKAAAEKIKSLHVRVFTAGVGDTVARKAAAMPQGAMRAEWFRALNRLSPFEELKVGRRYKTVVDPNNL